MAAKRTFHEIRELLLLSLAIGKKAINQLASAAGVNWRTTENHLTYLLGRGMVVEVFTSDYVRIFELSEKGKEYIAQMHPHIQFEEKKTNG